MTNSWYFKSRLSQAAIVGLVSQLQALQSLQLYWNLNIRDEALVALAASSPQLRRLSLSGCKNVTDAGLRSLAGACSQLTHLDLTRQECWEPLNAEPYNLDSSPNRASQAPAAS